MTARILQVSFTKGLRYREDTYKARQSFYLFAGFIFGKWYGLLFAIIGMTFGATLLYIFANYFLNSHLMNDSVILKMHLNCFCLGKKL